MKGKKWHSWLGHYGTLLGCIVFPLVWLIIDGITVGVDTASYVNFGETREPIYPIVLAVFRFVFGETYYFWWIGVFQCVLTGYAVWKVTVILKNKLHLGWCASAVILCIQFGVCLMPRFFAGRKTFYCLTIITEGIAIPLFSLFLVHFYEFLIDKKGKKLFIAHIYAFLLVLLRTHMFVTLSIMGTMYILLVLTRKIHWKKFLLYLSFLLCIVGSVKLMERAYNYVVYGRAIEKTTDVTMLVTCLFVAQPEDANAIQDVSLKELYYNMVKQVEEHQWGYEDAPKSVWELEDFYSNNYDNISYEVLKPTVGKYVMQKNDGFATHTLMYNETVDRLLVKTLFQNPARKAKILFANAFCGLMNTVAKNHRLFIGYVIGVCLLYVIMLFKMKKMERKSTVVFGTLVLVSVVMNVMVVSFMIFTQSRYMIYNMSLFYIALYLMVKEYVLNKRKKGQQYGQDSSADTLLQRGTDD